MTSPRNSPWMPEKLALLIECIQTKKSGAETAALLGLTRSAVIGRAHRMGLRFLSTPSTTRRRDRRKDNNSNIVRRIAAKAIVIEQVFPYRNSPEPEYLNKTLLELAFDECHYIKGNDYLYCGAPVWDETPYCKHHFDRMHTAPLGKSAKLVAWKTWKNG